MAILGFETCLQTPQKQPRPFIIGRFTVLPLCNLAALATHRPICTQLCFDHFFVIVEFVRT